MNISNLTEKGISVSLKQVGYSMGGTIAMQMASLVQYMTTNLILLDPSRKIDQICAEKTHKEMKPKLSDEEYD